MSNYLNKSRAIFGIKSTSLNQEEIAFFKDINPLGFIIFSRNIESRDQVQALTDSFKNLAGHEDTPILIDQEGGRVARLRPPLFAEHKPAEYFANIAKTDIEKAKLATFLNYFLIGSDLSNLGINVNCAPVCDLRFDFAHEIIGTRSFGTDPKIVAQLASSCADGLNSSGVIPIIKHIPGHGRALSDSHEHLPIVDNDLQTLEQTDFAVFRDLTHYHWAMTAHIIYTAIDGDHPATQSAKAIDYIRNVIDYKNLIISDDLSMKALSGTYAERTKLSFDAGCDLVLHCNGEMDEMKAISSALKQIDTRIAEKITQSFFATRNNASNNYQDFIHLNHETINEVIEQCAA